MSKAYKCEVCGCYMDWGAIFRWGKDYCSECYMDMLQRLVFVEENRVN